MSPRLPVVASALGGSDQAERVAHYAEQGLLLSSAPEASKLAVSVLSLHGDPARREAMLGRQAALPLRNGLETAVESLAYLLRTQSGEPNADVDSRT